MVDLGLRRTYETAVDDTCSLCTRHKAGPCKTAFTFISSHVPMSPYFSSHSHSHFYIKDKLNICKIPGSLSATSVSIPKSARSCSPLLQSMARLIGRPDTSSTDAFIIASKPPTSFFYVPCKSHVVYFLRRAVEVSL